METTPRGRHTERKRAPLFWALIELHHIAEHRLKSVRGIGDRRRQILRSLLRAATAFTHASAGRDVVPHLTRVRAAIDDCEVGFLLLHEHLGSDFVALALAHIDRIVRAIDQLTGIEPAGWSDAELPPLPVADEQTGSEQPTITVLRQLTARIVALLQAHLPVAASPNHFRHHRKRSGRRGGS